MRYINGFLLVFISLVFSTTHTFSATKNIRIAIGDWPPYASESLPHKGLLPLILKKAFAYSDTQVTFDFMSWDEAYDKTRDGEYDLSPGWIKTPIREKEVLFSQAVNYIDLRFFHASDKELSWEEIEEVYQLKLGIVSGYSYGVKLDSAIKQNHIKTRQYDNEREALRGIAKKEIDIYPADALVSTYILNTLANSIKDKVIFDEHTISNSPIFLIGKHDTSQTLIDTFNSGLNKLIASGDYAKILENFHLVNKLGKLNFITEDNAPINYQSENGPAGIMVAAINTILTELGADTSKAPIQVYPWARAYQTLEQRSNTVLFALTKTQQRADKFKWVGPIYRSKIILLGLKEQSSTDLPLSLDDIIQKNVCAVKNDVGEQLWKSISSQTESKRLAKHT